MYIFVTHNRRGNAGATKIPTAFSGNTSPRLLIYPGLAKPSQTQRSRTPAKRAAKKDLAIQDTSREI
jgi:hypothetical protein